LEILAKREVGGIIASPEISGMEPRIMESLTAEIDVQLTGYSPHGGETVLFQDRGTSAGLEVAGTVEEIVDTPNP
jgi:hypothetical protein